MAEEVSQIQLISYLKKHVRHWCPVVSSKQIKKLIINRCDELGITVQEAAIASGVNVRVVSKYWINEEEPVSRPAIRAEDLIKIGKTIGIEIRTLAVVKPLDKSKRNEILDHGKK